MLRIRCIELLYPRRKGNRCTYPRHKDSVPKKGRFLGVRWHGRHLWRSATWMSRIALPLKIDPFSGSRRPHCQSRVSATVADWDSS